MNKKRNFKKRSKREESDRVVESTEKQNTNSVSRFANAQLYFNDPKLAEMASRFSFQSFIGDGNLVGQAKLPSICVLPINPAINSSYYYYARQAGVNMAARKLYNQLANRSGRTQTYGPQDLVMLILSLGEIITMASFIRRTFGLAFTYNIRNRDFPQHIIEALGTDADDLFKHLSEYRLRFNGVINTANKIPFLANVPWFAKCASLFETIYLDSTDPMAGIYAFVPATSWKLNETAVSSGSILETINVYCQKTAYNTRNRKTMKDWIDLLQEQITILLESSTLNIIYADVLNYASQSGSNLLHFDIIDESYGVTPVYDPEILLQIKNANMNGGPQFLTSLVSEGTGVSITAKTPYNDVYQSTEDTSVVYAPIFKPYTSATVPASGTVRTPGGLGKILDFDTGDPDTVQRIESTRFKSMFVEYGKFAVNSSTKIDASLSFVLPDHYIVGFYIFEGSNPLSDQNFWMGNNYINLINANDADLPGWAVRVYEYLNKFSHHPMIYTLSVDGKNTVGMLDDVNYWTQIDENYLWQVNDLIYQHLFEVQ